MLAVKKCEISLISQQSAQPGNIIKYYISIFNSMGKRDTKSGKSAGCAGCKVKRGGACAQAAGLFFAPEIVQGIYRYTRLAGPVYSVYRETTHKYIGLALYDGKEFKDCTPQDLIQALESKDRK